MFYFFRVFEQLSSSIGRQVMTGQSQSQYSGFAVLTGAVSKFCSQHDLTKIPIKSDKEQKAYDTCAANDIKEKVVSDSYETICMLSSKAMTL